MLLEIFREVVFYCRLPICNNFLCFPTQTGGYTNANYIWDLMQARKIVPSLPAVEAYYSGLKVSTFTSCTLVCESISCLSLFIISFLLGIVRNNQGFLVGSGN